MSEQSGLRFNSERCFIGGEWVTPVSGEVLALENPSDGSIICRIVRGGAEDIDKAVGAAQAAGRNKTSSRAPAQVRRARLRRAPTLFRLHSGTAIMSAMMGWF